MNERWVAVVNFSVVSAFVFLGVSVVSPILPQYAMTFNVPVALTCMHAAGMFSDKYDRKKVMVTGHFTSSSKSFRHSCMHAMML